MEKSARLDNVSKLNRKIQLLKKGEVIGNYCFYAGVWILLLVMMLGHSVWEMPYRGRLLQAVFALFCIKIKQGFPARNPCFTDPLSSMGCQIRLPPLLPHPEGSFRQNAGLVSVYFKNCHKINLRFFIW